MSRLKVLYGFHAVTARLRHDASTVEDVYYDPTRRDRRMQEFLHAAKDAGARLIAADETRLWGLAHTERHQGVVARYKAPAALAETNLAALVEKAGRDALLLVLDGVTDPHNFGACLRSSEAAGVTAVVVPKDRAVGVTPTVRRASAGAADRVPIVAATNLARMLKSIKDAGVWLVGLDGDATQSVYDIDLKGPIALVLGGEGEGMRRLTREACDFVAKIPMRGDVESLNVSVSTGIVLFEALRQRG